MKKIIVITTFILLAGAAFGQTLQKGGILAVRSYTVILQPDVTMNQFLDFCINKYNPAFEKNYPGVKIFMLMGDRGEKKNQIGEILYFESVKLRDKYWPVEDTSSDFEKAAAEKMKPIDEEFRKLVVDITNDYTDWVIK